MKNEHEVSAQQLESAKKNIEWMERSKPSVAARSSEHEISNCHRQKDVQTQGEALPPHERNCGRAHPMRGTNSEDLTEWCIEHESYRANGRCGGCGRVACSPRCVAVFYFFADL